MAKRKRQFKLGRATRSFGHQPAEHKAIADAAYKEAREFYAAANQAAKSGDQVGCLHGVRALATAQYLAGQFLAHDQGSGAAGNKRGLTQLGVDATYRVQGACERAIRAAKKGK